MRFLFQLSLLCVAAFFMVDQVAFAQDLMAPAETILDQFREAVLGPIGITIGALLLIVTVIAAFSERTQIQPIHILWVMLGLGLIFGAFPIVEAIQGLVA